MPAYAVSDIHGCARTFTSLLEHLAFSKGDVLYLLGDYIDRGPDSKVVIDQILRLQSEGYDVQCLVGNHELLLLESFADEDTLQRWLRCGGTETLESFGVARVEDIPLEYFQFLKNLRYFIEIEGYILVHAGLSFFEKGRLNDTNSMVWRRSWYSEIDYEWLGNRVIIHGHTPQPFDESISQLMQINTNRYLNIDNGCVYAPRAKGYDMGNLLAFDLTNRKLLSVANQEGK